MSSRQINVDQMPCGQIVSIERVVEHDLLLPRPKRQRLDVPATKLPGGDVEQHRPALGQYLRTDVLHLAFLGRRESEDLRLASVGWTRDRDFVLTRRKERASTFPSSSLEFSPRFPSLENTAFTTLAPTLRGRGFSGTSAASRFTPSVTTTTRNPRPNPSSHQKNVPPLEKVGPSSSNGSIKSTL